MFYWGTQLFDIVDAYFRTTDELETKPRDGGWGKEKDNYYLSLIYIYCHVHTISRITFFIHNNIQDDGP